MYEIGNSESQPRKRWRVAGIAAGLLGTAVLCQPDSARAQLPGGGLPSQVKEQLLDAAAKATGMSKAALSRAVKNGTMSAKKQPNGSNQIDPAELHSEYPPAAMRNLDPAELNALNGELRAKLDAATQQLAEMNDLLAEMRDDRNQWREQAQRLALTDQRAKPPDVVEALPQTSQQP
jgi:hypothetical protein